MTRETDKTIVKKIETIDGKTTGITLISASTGKGKTYSLIQYAKKGIEEDRYDKIVIIEPRHSILKEVEDNLRSWGINEILYLRNAADNTVQFIDSINVRSIKDKYIKEEIQKLSQYADAYKPETDTVQNRLIEDAIFAEKSELKRYCLENKKRLDPDELNEVEKIFPEKLIPSNHFILMSMDKLFYTLDTIKKDNRILSKRIFSEKTLVIVDELDKCYTVALNRLAENRDTLDDLLAVIQNAYAFIAETDSRWQRFENEEINEEVENKREQLLAEINELHSKYGVLNNFVFQGQPGEKLELFVSRSKTFVASEGKHFKLSINNDDSRTVLEQVDRKTDFSVISFVVECKKVVRDILNFIFDLGEAYKKGKDADASYEEGLLYGISQVFNKTLSESNHYLNYAIDNTLKTQALRITSGEFIDDNSVCNNGFSHCILDDKPGTNHTYMTSTGIDLTPENVFVWLGKNANVVGLSATQQIPTVLNLDLDYVSRALGENYDQYSPEDFEYANSNIDDNHDTECDIVLSFNSNREQLYNKLAQLLVDEEIEEAPQFKENVYEFADAIDTKYTKDDSMKDREYKRFYALCLFLIKRKAVSGLVILNSNYAYLERFKEFVARVSQIMSINPIDKENIYLISANNLEENLTTIKNKLNNGIKCLIISNKEALGQGVNIQYDKDFNFFYQEDPTHIIPVIKKESVLSPAETNKYIYLVMKMASVGEITDYEMKGWVSNIVSNTPHKINCYSSVALAKTSIFIQGLGRTTRGSEKEECELIYLDEELCNYLRLEDVPVEKTPELKAVEKRIQKYKEEKNQSDIDSMNSVERQLCENSNKLQNEIHRLLSTFAKPNMNDERELARKEYDDLLRIVYKYGLWPTHVDQEDQALFDKLGYVKVNEVLDKMYIKSSSGNYCEDLICVSSDYRNDATELEADSVLKLKKYQKPNGECWQINPKAMNLLQGIVGEMRFKELFELHTYYKLTRLSIDEYEICGDYLVEDTDIYVDVKNYSEYGTRDITDFAMSKLETIKHHNKDGKLIIVNVYAKNKYEKPNNTQDDLLLVTNVLGENGAKYWNNISAIEEWIDENT